MPRLLELALRFLIALPPFKHLYISHLNNIERSKLSAVHEAFTKYEGDNPSILKRLQGEGWVKSEHYSLNMNDQIAILCDQYGSDKGSTQISGHTYSWPPHNYSVFYTQKFAAIQNSVSTIFECGIGSNNLEVESNMGVNGRPGASLRVWRDFFQNAVVYGADIDRNALFQENRIVTAYMDQLSEASINDYFTSINQTFDIMIDDGLHTVEASLTLFENSFQYLKPGGMYMIEDVNPDSLLSFNSFFNKLGLPVEIIVLLRNSIELKDNLLICVQKNLI
jgi:hypothetical protein